MDGELSPVDPIACFNMNNGSISINKGEMLPFYWNIERIGTDNDHYVEIRNYEYRDALDNYDRLQGSSCQDYEHGDIALNAMVCNFKVYNGTELQSKGNYLYNIEVPCFTRGSDIQRDWSSSALISSFVNWNHNNFIKDGNSNGGDTFWSYNIDNNR